MIDHRSAQSMPQAISAQQGNMRAATKTPDLESQFKRLAGGVDRLGELLISLETKLMSVMAEQEPSGPRDGMADCQGRCAASEGVRSQAAKIESLAACVESILQRLEI